MSIYILIQLRDQENSWTYARTLGEDEADLIQSIEVVRYDGFGHFIKSEPSGEELNP